MSNLFQFFGDLDDSEKTPIALVRADSIEEWLYKAKGRDIYKLYGVRNITHEEFLEYLKHQMNLLINSI